MLYVFEQADSWVAAVCVSVAVAFCCCGRSYILDAIDSSVDMINDGIILLQEAAPNPKLFPKLQKLRVRINRLLQLLLDLAVWVVVIWQQLLEVVMRGTRRDVAAVGAAALSTDPHRYMPFVCYPPAAAACMLSFLQPQLQQLLQMFAQSVSIWRNMVASGASLDYPAAAEMIQNSESMSKGFLQACHQVRVGH